MGVVAELREALARRHPDALPVAYRTAGAVATGIRELDAVLPNGGLPRGRLVAWAVGGGATAVLRGACRSVVKRGERAAWVDGGGLLTADSWDPERDPVLLRPAGETEALACAEELLRSGGFALVVLAGVPRGAGREAVRLSRAAKEGGGAFVALTEDAAVAHLRVTQRVSAGGYAWRLNPFGEPVDVTSAEIVLDAKAMGWSGSATFRLPVRTWEARLSLDPMLVDRRGVRRGSRRRLPAAPQAKSVTAGTRAGTAAAGRRDDRSVVSGPGREGARTSGVRDGTVGALRAPVATQEGSAAERRARGAA